MRTYKITHLVNDRRQTVAVDARDAADAQERFVDHCETTGVVHGTILRIRAALATAEAA
jgi:hypothetical protein